MSTAGVDHLEAIQLDLACPSCEYNLRGLRGQVVQCPECGLMIDAATLIADKWKIPWQKAPGYDTIAIPILPFAIAMILSLSLAMFAADAPHIRIRQAAIVIGGVIATMLVTWLAMIWRVHQKLDGSWGLRMCAAAHAVVVGYFVCFWGGVVLLGMSVFGRMFLPLHLIAFLFGCACFAGLRYMYRADRAIGTALIGRYLRKQRLVSAKADA